MTLVTAANAAALTRSVEAIRECETMTGSVTAVLRERLARQHARREAAAELPARLAAPSRRLSAAYDMGPVSKAEWDEELR